MTSARLFNSNCYVHVFQHRIAAVQSTNRSPTPTLRHVISGDGREVSGVTSIGSRLLELRSPCFEQIQHIQVYDTNSFKEQKPLQVKDLSDNESYGMTSCVTNNCVYVSDDAKSIIFKVELSGNNKVSSWQVARDPQGLSINRSCNLLVACYAANKIQEFTKDGKLVRDLFYLESNYVEMRPLHAIQLTSNQLVVSCGKINGVGRG